METLIAIAHLASGDVHRLSGSECLFARRVYPAYLLWGDAKMLKHLHAALMCPCHPLFLSAPYSETPRLKAPSPP